MLQSVWGLHSVESAHPCLLSRGLCPQVLLNAVAQKSYSAQSQLLEAVGLWCRAMTETQDIIPIAFVWKVKYDETPMNVRVSYPTSSHGQNKDCHKHAKGWVIESSWSATFKVKEPGDGSSMFMLTASLAPELRVSKTKTAESIIGVLNSCHQPPAGLPFPLKLRVVDSDAASNNKRCERLLTHLGWHDWKTMQVECLCHKVHGGVERCMDLFPKVTTGLKNLILHLTAALPAVREALAAVIEDELEVIAGQPDLSATAVAYREQVVSVFTPPSSKSRGILGVIAEHVLNGDWRRGLTHYCRGPRGCCENRREAVQKAQLAVSTLFTAIMPKLLLGNWAEWRRSYHFVGVFGHMHGLLFKLGAKMNIVVSGEQQPSCTLPHFSALAVLMKQLDGGLLFFWEQEGYLPLSSTPAEDSTKT